MSAQIDNEIAAAIKTYIDPYLGTDLITAKALKTAFFAENTLELNCELGIPLARYGAELEQALCEALRSVAGTREIHVNLQSKIETRAVQRGTKPLAQVKNTIAVASGKGGVGKSTTATNLAIALRDEGANVGILDADIYGPSQPRMLGAAGHPESRDGKSMEPKESFGIQMISIGNLVDEDTPMIWRGPMATSALDQLIGETNWRDLDYLVIDLPPGTGDIQLTLAQRIPVSGALIVTTPQDIALLDARKSLKMFEKVDVPVLGIIENMSVHICSNCGHAESIFGTGGGAAMAAQYDVELLASIPLDRRIREGVDNGKPTVALQPDSPTATVFREIARKTAAKLALRAKDFSGRFPNIVVQSS